MARMKWFLWVAILAGAMPTMRGGEAPVAKFGALGAGTLALDFTVTGTDGKPIKLSDFKGKTVVLNFWATNRGPAEALESVAVEQATAGVVVLGVCTGASREDFEKWVQKTKASISYPLAWDPAGKSPTEVSAAKKFGIGAFPATGVIDPAGKIVGGFTGFGAQSGAILRGYLRTAGVAMPAEEKPVAGLPPGPEHLNELKPGAVAPDFTALDAAGRAVKLSDFAGKIVVLDFWATWCSPCLDAMPHTQQIAAAAKAQGVIVFAACTSDTRAAFESWMKGNAPKYPDVVFANDPIGRDTPATYSDRASVKGYGVSGLPTVFVIGRDGKVAEVFSGSGEGDTRLEEALKKLGVNF
jgi:peroxiredoxin